MAFKKGESGNLTGRPKGIPDKRTVYREALQDRATEIVEALVDKALEGDTTALRICVDRIVPALKSVDSPVSIELSGSLSAQGQQVLSAIGTGRLAPGEGTALMSTLQAQARLVETDEILERIERLEAGAKS